MKMQVVSVEAVDFIGREGEPVKYNRIYIRDDRGSVGYVNSTKSAKPGDFIEFSLFIDSKGQIKPRLV